MMNTEVRLVRCPTCQKLLQEPSGVLLYECGGCGTKLQAKKRKNDTIDTTSQRFEDDSSGKQKMEHLSDKHEASSRSLKSQLVVDGSSDEVKEYSSEKWKLKQLSDAEQVCSSSNQQSAVNLIVGTDQNVECNDPRSSTELSGHEDPESSPETAAHTRMVQQDRQNVTVVFERSFDKQKIEQLCDEHETGNILDQQSLVKLTREPDEDNDHEGPHNSYKLLYREVKVQNRFDADNDKDYDQEFQSCRNMDLTSSSFSELEEPLLSNNRKINRDSDGGLKSSFKSLIAENLLDTRQKKVMQQEEDDMLSEEGTADLSHRRRFDRISSLDTSEHARFGGTSNYYGCEGSVSSFDGNENKVTRKNQIGLKGDEYVDSGNRYRFNRRIKFHPLNEHRLMGVRSSYGLNKFPSNPRSHSAAIPENPEMERIKLLRMVGELQDQLERTNNSNSAQQIPEYYDHVSNYPSRFGHRMAFSGKTTPVNTRRNNSLCQQHVCYNGPRYGPNDYYSTFYSGPSCPKHHSESELLAPDDHRHRNEVMKPYPSPKMKQYIRPIAGGSPWITCYRCSELLQLPQSFLVFKKRYHSLRCGACLKVLKFNLSNGTHVSRYHSEESIAAPPTSEVEDYDKSNGSRADPVSCSDRSYQRDYSTETDKYGSRKFSEERKKAAMSRDPSASTHRRRKTTSEIEEVKRGTNASPLHWLMGYASPSKVTRG